LTRRDLFLCLALLLATVAVYSQVAHFDFVNYDDPDYTTGNFHVRTGLTGANLKWAFTTSYAANWFPLTWLSHMLDFQLHGPGAGAQHVTNLELHLLNTVILFLVLRRITQASAASAFVASVFALHPLHVESVAWIADRKDLLCTLFFLLTIAAYVGFVRKPSAWRYALLVVLFACALMSKSMAVTLPFVLLLLDYWPLQRFKMVNIRRLLLEKMPLFGLALASSIVTFIVQRNAGAVVDSIPVGTRIANALVSYAAYLLKFVWPANLAVFYPYAEIPLWQTIAAAALLTAITVIVIRLRNKRQSLVFGWFWFLGTLLPVIGLVQVGVQARADRYTYIPMIGIAIMIAWSFKAYVKKRRWVKPPLALLTAILCMIWGAVAWRNLTYWQDSGALFQHAIDVTTGNYVAYSNLGWALTQKGQSHEAVQSFERALSIKRNFADAENGLGEALSADKRFGEAMPHAIEAVRLEPKSLSAHINLGAAYSRRGHYQEAAEQYQLGLQIDPDSPAAHGGLGVALTEQGHLPEAIAELVESIRLNSDYADGHYNLGRAYGLQGRNEQAMTEFREAIRIQPTSPEAHYNLGTALASRDRFSDALDEFKTAVRLRPDYVNARFGYASALATLGNYGEAVQQFAAILRLEPGFKPAQESLAMSTYLLDHPEARPSANPNAATPERNGQKSKK
jgi:tetratricopeptide (TPR) repeat protein